MTPKAMIRDRVLRGLAANRIPGFHFAGSFLGVSFEDISASGSRIRLEGGPHCTESDGQVSLGAVAMIADIALAVTIRAALDSDRVRLATVSMHLQFTGARMEGPI